jgi:hypothetical protein
MLTITKSGSERILEPDFHESCATILLLNGIETARFFVAAQLTEDAMGELSGICSYREFLEFVETNSLLYLLCVYLLCV